MWLMVQNWYASFERATKAIMDTNNHDRSISMYDPRIAPTTEQINLHPVVAFDAVL